MGGYCLIMRLNKNKAIKIGKLGKIGFKKGYYIYVGSGGFARVRRHLSREKKLKWHIDYFLIEAKIIDVIYIKDECNVARQLAKRFPSITGFGCSDCSCKSHLFYF